MPSRTRRAITRPGRAPQVGVTSLPDATHPRIVQLADGTVGFRGENVGAGVGNLGNRWESAARIGSDDAAADGDGGHLGPCAAFEFGEEAGDVCLNGARADVECGGDFAVGPSVDE